MINRVSCQNQKAWSSALFQQERMQKVWNSKEILMKMRTKRASAVTILSFFKNERGVTATPPFGIMSTIIITRASQVRPAGRLPGDALASLIL